MNRQPDDRTPGSLEPAVSGRRCLEATPRCRTRPSSTLLETEAPPRLSRRRPVLENDARSLHRIRTGCRSLPLRLVRPRHGSTRHGGNPLLDVISDLGVVTATVVALTMLRSAVSRSTPAASGFGIWTSHRIPWIRSSASSYPRVRVHTGLRYAKHTDEWCGRFGLPFRTCALAASRAATRSADERRTGRALHIEARHGQGVTTHRGATALRSAPKRNPRTLPWPHPGVDQVPR